MMLKIMEMWMGRERNTGEDDSDDDGDDDDNDCKGVWLFGVNLLLLLYERYRQL